MGKISSVLDNHPEYAVNIGIEVHIQLETKSKIFCPCSNKVSKNQNENICPICCGYPGVLPVINKEVINNAILMGLASKCTINKQCTFARKHYFYPDLPKNYQITQSSPPICSEGYIPIKKEDGTVKKIRLFRIHIEEDAGKNIHSEVSQESFVDLNRTGTPLLEVVSYPDIASTYEARAYLKMLHTMVQYLGVGTGNMEQGAFRADTNISVRKKTDQKLGTRCELKNINSFKFICDAIEYEIERQINVLESGEAVAQQTMSWNSKKRETFSMRSKEEAADYRYFEEPDLPILEINNEWIDRVKSRLPELPFEKLNRYCSELGLSEYEAEIIIGNLPMTKYFETASSYSQSKHVINLLLRNVIGHLKENKITIEQFKLSPKRLAELAELLEQGKINSHTAQEIFAESIETQKSPAEIVKEKGLEQIGSEEELEKIVKQIVDENSEQAEQYKAGKERLFGFFVGTAMKKTKGKGNPKIIQALLKKYLS